MNRVAFALIAAIVFASMLATAQGAVRDLDDGGIVRAPIVGKVIVVRNDQKIIPAAVLEPVLADVTTFMMLPVVLQSTDSATSPQAPGVEIVLGEKPDTPALLIAPEESKAMINLTALTKDSPSEDVLAKRVSTEIWRALAYACSGTDSDFQPCYMRTILKLSDLDSHPELNLPSPMVLNKIIEGAEKRGIDLIREDTYRNAYMEGWAPPPVNDVQRGIKEEIDKNRRSRSKRK